MFSQPPRSGEVYGWGHEGSRTISQRHSTTSTYTGDVRYSYDLSSISAISTVGFQAFDQKTDIISAESSLFDNPALMEIEAGNNYSSLMEINNNFRSAGIFTEHSFSLNDTYFSSFMVRHDYASVLGSGTASIIYTRASFAVRVDREQESGRGRPRLRRWIFSDCCPTVAVRFRQNVSGSSGRSGPDCQRHNDLDDRWS